MELRGMRNDEDREVKLESIIHTHTYIKRKSCIATLVNANFKDQKCVSLTLERRASSKVHSFMAK